VSQDRTPSRPARQRLGAAERRRSIVRATVTVVAARGYERASFAEIARTAGVSKGLIWHYFTDGEDLLVQTARTTLVDLREAVVAELDLSAPVPDVVRAAIAAAARLVHTHAEQLAAMDAIVRGMRAPDGAPRLDSSEYEETYAGQEALFRRGQDEGSLRALDPRLMAVTYQGAVDTMLAHLRAHPEVDGAGYARSLADLLLGGMAPDPRS
jgi:AcrR family transcriptional regulator